MYPGLHLLLVIATVWQLRQSYQRQ